MTYTVSSGTLNPTQLNSTQTQCKTIKTVWQEQKGSGSCCYIRHKKKPACKHKINNEKWNTQTHTHTEIKTAVTN